MNKGIKYEIRVVKDARKKGLNSRWNFSGMGVFKKGDLQIEQFLVEAKTTEKSSFSVRANLLEKIRKEATRKALKPAMLVNVKGQEYIILEFEDFLDLLDLIAELKQKKGN